MRSGPARSPALRVVAMNVVRLVVGCFRVHAAGKIQHLNLPELRRVTLPLKGYIAFSKRRAVLFDGRVEVAHVGTTDLEAVIFQYRLAVDDVADVPGAKYLHFYPNPLVSPVSL